MCSENFRKPFGPDLACCNVHHYFKKDRSTLDFSASAWKQAPVDVTDCLKCDLCHIDLQNQEGDSENTIFAKKNHYMVACPAVPCDPVRQISPSCNREQMVRLAGISIIKRIGTVDSVRGRPPSPSSSSIRPNISDKRVSWKEKPPDT